MRDLVIMWGFIYDVRIGIERYFCLKCDIFKEKLILNGQI